MQGYNIERGLNTVANRAGNSLDSVRSQVSEGFGLGGQVEERPWLMLGAALAPPERPGDRAFLVRVEHRIDAEAAYRAALARAIGINLATIGADVSPTTTSARIAMPGRYCRTSRFCASVHDNESKTCRSFAAVSPVEPTPCSISGSSTATRCGCRSRARAARRPAP